MAKAAGPRRSASIHDDVEASNALPKRAGFLNDSCSSSLPEDVCENASEPLLSGTSKKPSIAGPLPGHASRYYRCLLAALLFTGVVGLVSLLCNGQKTPESFGSTDADPVLLQEGLNTTVSTVWQSNESWRPFDASTSDPFKQYPQALRILDSQRRIPQACADLWIARGQLCGRLEQAKLGDSSVDAVWTWVVENEHWTKWRDLLQGNTKSTKSPGRMFRSHQQLKYSMRSVFAAIPKVRKVHLLTSDLPTCDAGPSCQGDLSSRVGQVPAWLALNLEPERFNLQHHWALFKSGSINATGWRSATLPVFNSLAIESQLDNVQDVAESFLYMNDDSYITGRMSSSDVATPLFGPVFRMQRNLLVKGEPPGTSHHRANGEWPSLTYANWLLDRRFGERGRPYLAHQAKVVSSPLLNEVASIWSSELEETAGVRFRGRDDEINTLFLATHYVLEKHREALLWSYFVARMDSSGNGTYSLGDRRRIIAEFADAPNALLMDDTEFRVYRPQRISPITDRADQFLEAAGLSQSRQTEYQFTSADGYALLPASQSISAWPNYATENGSGQVHAVILNLEKCFGSSDFGNEKYAGDSASQTLFQRMAFGYPECGDAAIEILLARSGVAGLEAFLPAATSQPVQENQKAPPLLGGSSKRWDAADFSLAKSLRDGWQARDYAVRLIQRYSYVIGHTEATLVLMRSHLQTKYALYDLLESIQTASGPAMVTLNDDLVSSRDVPTVDALLATWHERLWPNRTQFEIVPEEKSVFEQ